MYKTDLLTHILRYAALVFRILAALLIALIVVVCLPVGELRPLLISAQRLASHVVVLPPLRGLLVFAVPTGGAFRGDLAIMAVVLLCGASLLDRIRRMR